MKNNVLLQIIKDKHLRIMIIPIIFASVFLVFGTYAWFTYFSDVNSTMTGHVIGWNIDFSSETEIEDEYNISVDKIYPGMEDYKSELVITNSGESTAFINYKIIEATILGTTYKVGDVIDDIEVTSDTLYEMLTTNYPFKFNFEITNNIVSNGENSSFKVDLVWDFETFVKVSESDTYDAFIDYYRLVDGEYVEVNVNSDNYSELVTELYMVNDIEDTYWGEKASKFMSENEDVSCIDLKIEINAMQYLDE